MTTAFILAGGLGSRLRSVVYKVPKPMAKVYERPFLEYLLEFWITQGISKFIISVSYLRSSIINYFGKSFNGIPIEYLIEKKPLGTGGGIIKVSKKLSKTFLVINGDTFFKISLNKLKLFKKKTKAGIVIALFKTDDKERYSQVCINKKFLVKKIVKSNKKYSKLSNGGVYLIDPEVIKQNSNKFKIKCSLESEILPLLIKKGSIVAGTQQRGKFLDIGIPDDYYRAKKFLAFENKKFIFKGLRKDK